MPMYDFQCEKCDTAKESLQPTGTRQIICDCGQTMVRVWLPTRTGGVIDDSIPGGLEIVNGLCSSDGTPRRFYSKSEIRAAGKQAGYLNVVEHKPPPGTDKSRITTRWV